MRLTVKTNLAMRVLMTCAVNGPELLNRREIAMATNASDAHLAVVINQLANNGFIETQRGRHGGIRLARPATDITVGAVFRSFEAQVPFAECFEPASNTCPLTPACRLQSAISVALDAFYSSLDQVTIAELTQDNRALCELLEICPKVCAAE